MKKNVAFLKPLLSADGRSCLLSFWARLVDARFYFFRGFQRVSGYLLILLVVFGCAAAQPKTDIYRKEIPADTLSLYYTSYSINEEIDEFGRYPNISSIVAAGDGKIAFFYQKRKKIVVLKEVSLDESKEFDRRIIIEIEQLEQVDVEGTPEPDTRMIPYVSDEYLLSSDDKEEPENVTSRVQISIFDFPTADIPRGFYISAGLENYDTLTKTPSAMALEEDELFEGSISAVKQSNGSWDLQANLDISYAASENADSNCRSSAIRGSREKTVTCSYSLKENFTIAP